MTYIWYYFLLYAFTQNFSKDHCAHSQLINLFLLLLQKQLLLLYSCTAIRKTKWAATCYRNQS